MSWKLPKTTGGAGVGEQVVSDIPRTFEHAVLRHKPRFPGILNLLIRKDLRQILSSLDVDLASLLSGGTAFVRLYGIDLPLHGLMILTARVVLSLSSCTLSPFGLDVPSGVSRYRLLPLRGWQSPVSKDLSVSLVSLPLLVPLQPVTGPGATLVALAIGHHSSVRAPGMQSPWRFSQGASFLPLGLIQAVGIASASAVVFFRGPLFLIPCIAGRGCQSAITERQLNGEYHWAARRCVRVLQCADPGTGSTADTVGSDNARTRPSYGGRTIYWREFGSQPRDTAASHSNRRSGSGDPLADELKEFL